MKPEEIIKALQWRYAVKTFDTEKKVSDADMHTILESGRLAPSSFGGEPWKFIVVTNSEVRAKLQAAGYGQTKIADASHLILLIYRTDVEALPAEMIERTAKTQGKSVEDFAEFKARVDGSVARMTTSEMKHAWSKSQTYIPLGIMIETAALLGVDACPMEGFNNAEVDEILGLADKHLASATMLAVGYRGDDAFAKFPKTRRPFDEVVETI
jgi:nitroreductase